MEIYQAALFPVAATLLLIWGVWREARTVALWPLIPCGISIAVGVITRDAMWSLWSYVIPMAVIGFGLWLRRTLKRK